MASVEAQITDGLTAYPLPVQASTLTESLVTLGALALRQQVWLPLPYNPEKGTGTEPDNNQFLHVSSDDPFIISGSEPLPGEHTLCQPIDTPENKTWQCFGVESVTSMALDTGKPFYLETHPQQSIVLSHPLGPKLTFSEYDLPDYLTFFKNQQTEMERIHKIATEEIAMGRLKIRIAEETTDEDTARRVYIAKTNGITVREQKNIEQEAERHREDAHVQSDDSAIPSDIDLPDDTVLCLASNRQACQEVLAKIVSCPNSEPDSTSEKNTASSQEGAQGGAEGQAPEQTDTGEDGAVATAAGSTAKDPEPPAKKSKRQDEEARHLVRDLTQYTNGLLNYFKLYLSDNRLGSLTPQEALDSANAVFGIVKKKMNVNNEELLDLMQRNMEDRQRANSSPDQFLPYHDYYRAFAKSATRTLAYEKAMKREEERERERNLKLLAIQQLRSYFKEVDERIEKALNGDDSVNKELDNLPLDDDRESDTNVLDDPKEEHLVNPQSDPEEFTQTNLSADQSPSKD